MLRNPLPRLLLTFLSIACMGVSTASAAVSDRIAAAVSGNARVTLTNSVHGKVRLATDLGPAPAGQQLQAMTLRFSLTAQQQAALDKLVVDQQNPASPQYHQWLTPATYASEFGLSSGDLAKVTAWLTSQGFTITEVANSASFVRFNGTVAEAQTAFSTSIHSLSLNGETHVANVTDASVPSALAGVVMGITGLHDFRLKARVVKNGVKSVAGPEYTASGLHYIAPGDFYTIYDENSLLTSSINGSGVTIAVMGQVDISLTDLAAFRTVFGLPANVPTIKVYGTDPGAPLCASSANCSPSDDDLEESTLDVEWSSAVAQAASVIFVTSIDAIEVSMTDAIDNNIAPIMTVSYGECESGWGASEMSVLNQLFEQGAAQGITILGPGGDTGATDCDTNIPAVYGLNVDFPASSPFVTAVGGNMFNEGTGSFWNTTNGTTGGSAISYIPEMVWNETGVTIGSEIAGGGGGVSAFFFKPAWQTGAGVPADGSRDVPDVALDAGANHDGYLVCVQSSCPSSFSVAGGTSFATPEFAGLMALVEQKTGARIGLANPTLYALAKSTYYSSVFHDVTVGNNDASCETGSPNCPAGGSIGYSAAAGYDLATGWGSVDAANLVADWKLVTPIALGTLGNASATTEVSLPGSPVSAGTSVVVTATVASGTTGFTTTPTGSVRFLVAGATTTYGVVTTAAGNTLASGTASYTLSTANLTPGTYDVAASYSGDSNYAGSLSADDLVDVVSATAPDVKLTPSIATLSVASGASGSVVYTVTPVNGFTGTVTFSVGTSATLLEDYGAAEFVPSSVAITSTAAGTTTLTLFSNASTAVGIGTGVLNVSSLTRREGPSPASRGRGGWYAAGSGVTIASLLLLTLPRRRRLGGLLMVALAVAMLGTASGCGTANPAITATPTTPTSTSTTVPAGTYPVTVTATAGAYSHTTTIAFTVQ